MQTDHGQVPDFPKISATITEGTEGVVSVNGVPHTVAGEDVKATRTAVVGVIADTARKLGRPVRAMTVDDLGEWPLIVYPDGLVENDSAVEPPKKKKKVGSGSSAAFKRTKKEKRERRPLLPNLSRKKTHGASGASGSEGMQQDQGEKEHGHRAPQLDRTVTHAPQEAAVEEPLAPPATVRQDSGARSTAPTGLEPGGHEQGGAGGSQAVQSSVPRPPDESLHNPVHPAPGASTEPVQDRPASRPRAGTPVPGASPVPPAVPEHSAPPGGFRAQTMPSGPRPNRVPDRFSDHVPAPATERSYGPVPTEPGPAAGPDTSPLNGDQARNAWLGAITEHNSARTRITSAPEMSGHRPASSGTGATAFLRRLLTGREGGQGVPEEEAAFPQGARMPLSGHRRITVLSLKGGVGKTTVAVLLGSILAAQYEQRAIAVDANSHGGTLRDRVPLQNGATVEDLAREAEKVDQYTQLRHYVSVNPERMHALVGSGLPVAGEMTPEHAYSAVSPLLTQHYDMVINDCGTGLEQAGTKNVLSRTDQLLLVLEPTLDSSRSARATLEWLSVNGFSALAEKAVAVVSRADHHADPNGELRQFEEQLTSAARGVVRIPYDHHLAEGGVIRLDRLHERTRTAGRHLAAVSTLALEGVLAPAD